MAFFHCPEGDSQRVLLGKISVNHGYTVLKARVGVVCAVSDEALLDIDLEDATFSRLTEADAVELLDEKGLEMFERMKEERPQFLYWNAALPPALHVAIEFTVAESVVERAKEMLTEFDAIDIATSEVTQILISDEVVNILTPEENDAEFSEQCKISAVLPGKHFAALLTRLQESRVAGFSRESRVLITADPDKMVNLGNS